VTYVSIYGKQNVWLSIIYKYHYNVYSFIKQYPISTFFCTKWTN